MDEPQPIQWVASLRRRDGEALRAIYERYQHDVLAVAATVLGPTNSHAAWDVLHDVFIAVASAGPKLLPDTNLRVYLVRAAVNRSRDRLQVRWTTDHDIDSLPAVQPLAGQSHEREEETRELWRQVTLLPDEQRLVVGLRIWGEMSFREIAELAGISENTAQSRWRYAIDKLRKHYEGAER